MYVFKCCIVLSPIQEFSFELVLVQPIYKNIEKCKYTYTVNFIFTHGEIISVNIEVEGSNNNKNKLLVHMYIVKNTTVFLIVRKLLLRYNYMFRPSMLAIFRLYMKHLTISYVYT
jgi:hypothetical protein